VNRNRSTIIVPAGSSGEEGWELFRNLLAEINEAVAPSFYPVPNQVLSRFPFLFDFPDNYVNFCQTAASKCILSANNLMSKQGLSLRNLPSPVQKNSIIAHQCCFIYLPN
jgi:hypothetical protein